MFKGQSKNPFSLFVLLAGIVFACLLLGLTAIILAALRPESHSIPAGTALLQVIAAPSDTPVLPTALPSLTPTLEPGTPLPPLPGVIAVGALVEIKGTGVDGLRLRSEPGLQGKVQFVGIEAEVFRVDQGPHEADGYTWWFLVAPYDEKVQGWAVSNYLNIVQNP